MPLRRMVHRQMPFQTQTAANWGNSLLVACSLKGNLALPRVCTAPDLRNIKVGLAEGIGVPALDISPALKEVGWSKLPDGPRIAGIPMQVPSWKRLSCSKIGMLSDLGGCQPGSQKPSQIISIPLC